MGNRMVRTTISPEELAQRAGELVERVGQGELAVVESAGRERAVLLDATDYRLLRALAACASAIRLSNCLLMNSLSGAIRPFAMARICNHANARSANSGFSERKPYPG